MFLRVQATFSWYSFCENCAIFFVLLYFDWFSFIFGWIFLGSVCKTALYVPEDLFEEKRLMLDFFSFFQPCPDLSENFSVLWQKLCGSLVKSALFPPAEQNEGNFVLKKCILFQQFSDVRVDRSGHSVAFFKSFVKSKIFVSKEVFWIKICLSSINVFVSFLNIEQTTFGLLTRSFLERFSELQLLVHSNVFMKDIFFEKWFFSRSFSVFKRNFSRFLVEILHRSWQKCISFVQRNNWWKTIFLKKKISLKICGF